MAKFALPSAAGNSYIPRVSACVAAFRTRGPAACESLTVQQADLITRQWSHQRTLAGRVEATLATQQRYFSDARQKARQYFPLGSTMKMTPKGFVDALFNDSKKLARDSFVRNRSALLFLAGLIAQNAKDPQQVNEWKIAQARLILQVEPPFTDMRAASSKPPKRVKAISAEDSNAIIATLRKGRGNAKKVAAFAEATLATGARPGEWANVQLLLADSEAGRGHGADTSHFALVFATGKRKGGAIEYRAVRVHLSLLDTIQAHIRFFQMAQRKNSPTRKTDAVAIYIKRCSGRLAATCELLFPGDKTRRIVLSSLRSQARADFATQFSKGEVATMMGHAIETGDGYYASKRKGSLQSHSKARCSPAPTPPSPTMVTATNPTPASTVCADTSVASSSSNAEGDADGAGDAEQGESWAPKP